MSSTQPPEQVFLWVFASPRRTSGSFLGARTSSDIEVLGIFISSADSCGPATLFQRAEFPVPERRNANGSVESHRLIGEIP